MLVQGVHAAEGITITGLTGLAFSWLSGFAFWLLFLHIFQRRLVPLVGLLTRQMGERSFSGDACLHGFASRSGRWSWFGIVGKVSLHIRQAIDCQIHRNVVQAANALGRLAPCYMLKDDMVKLVLQDRKSVLVAQTRHEVRVIQHFKLCPFGINANTRSRDRSRRGLVDPPRQCGKKRLAHKQPRRVHIQVEWGDGLVVVHRVISLLHIQYSISK